MLTPRDVACGRYGLSHNALSQEPVTPAEHRVPQNRQDVGANSREQGIAIADEADDSLMVLDQLANPDFLTAEVIAVGDTGFRVTQDATQSAEVTVICDPRVELSTKRIRVGDHVYVITCELEGTTGPAKKRHRSDRVNVARAVRREKHAWQSREYRRVERARALRERRRVERARALVKHRRKKNAGALTKQLIAVFRRVAHGLHWYEFVKSQQRQNSQKEFLSSNSNGSPELYFSNDAADDNRSGRKFFLSTMIRISMLRSQDATQSAEVTVICDPRVELSTKRIRVGDHVYVITCELEGTTGPAKKRHRSDRVNVARAVRREKHAWQSREYRRVERARALRERRRVERARALVKHRRKKNAGALTKQLIAVFRRVAHGLHWYEFVKSQQRQNSQKEFLSSNSNGSPELYFSNDAADDNRSGRKFFLSTMIRISMLRWQHCQHDKRFVVPEEDSQLFRDLGNVCETSVAAQRGVEKMIHQKKLQAFQLSFYTRRAFAALDAAWNCTANGASDGIFRYFVANPELESLGSVYSLVDVYDDIRSGGAVLRTLDDAHAQLEIVWNSWAKVLTLRTTPNQKFETTLKSKSDLQIEDTQITRHDLDHWDLMVQLFDEEWEAFGDEVPIAEQYTPPPRGQDVRNTRVVGVKATANEREGDHSTSAVNQAGQAAASLLVSGTETVEENSSLPLSGDQVEDQTTQSLRNSAFIYVDDDEELIEHAEVPTYVSMCSSAHSDIATHDPAQTTTDYKSAIASDVHQKPEYFIVDDEEGVGNSTQNDRKLATAVGSPSNSIPILGYESFATSARFAVAIDDDDDDEETIDRFSKINRQDAPLTRASSLASSCTIASVASSAMAVAPPQVWRNVVPRRVSFPERLMPIAGGANAPTATYASTQGGRVATTSVYQTLSAWETLAAPTAPAPVSLVTPAPAAPTAPAPVYLVNQPLPWYSRLWPGK
ncbi:Hypothetical protein, putative [Bodo saltans]|uniref:Uncharacterized protein n=1 Tax=Bodo saltans TaxID=75058 RepID=A0A0S4IV99_BODSA|nr:Hypothetical protein, putative [Bodo saltans]|eukprot:CUF54683.1 Hypothetical protein, putative [Bodo saltans]